MRDEWFVSTVNYLALAAEGTSGAWKISLLLAGGILMLVLGLRQRPRLISWLGFALVAAGLILLSIRAMTISYFGIL
jgi:hypothetical protein